MQAKLDSASGGLTLPSCTYRLTVMDEQFSLTKAHRGKDSVITSVVPFERITSPLTAFLPSAVHRYTPKTEEDTIFPIDLGPRSAYEPGRATIPQI